MRKVNQPVLAIIGLIAASAAAEPAKIAVALFDYVDGSGEVLDQRAAHAERLAAFSQSLRSDLAQDGRYLVVALDCAVVCSSAPVDLTGLFAEAARQGADLLLFGSIHKQSTLIQWAKADLVDVRTQQVVLDRLLTFRGDDDESWARAEQFLVKDVRALRVSD